MIQPVEMILPDVPPDPPAPTYTMPPLAFERFRKNFTDADFKPIIEGEVIPPNMVPLTLVEAVDRLFYMSDDKSGYPRLDAEPRRGYNPGKFYFAHSPYGHPTGKGMVIVRVGVDVHAYEFALCRHEFEADAGNNPRRGHNFGHCSKCGLDLSVDSSD